MSYLTATQLAKSFGVQDVFTGISLSIPQQARIALVGQNGVGKTSLLRILAGLDRPDAGQVHRARALTIGYLPQDQSFAPLDSASQQQTVWDSCLLAFERLRRDEADLQRLETQMASADTSEELLARYGVLQEHFERAGGYTYVSKIKSVLNGLGLGERFHQRPLVQLSGGERTRAYLASLLLQAPDLLLLDEPTNHLDIEAVEWLEGWLRDWQGSVVIVSHDRYFLDRTVRNVWDLTSSGLETYRGNYSAYVQQRAERLSLLETQYRAQQEIIQKEEDFIQRNIAGQNSRQAQGRRKRLERMIRDHAIDRPRTEKGVRLQFAAGERSGNKVIETEDLVVRHPEQDQPLVVVPDLVLERGECAAIVGPNGAGKTTFLKTLLEEIKPLSGSIRLGAAIEIGYLSQAHEDLNLEKTLISEIHDLAPEMSNVEVRDLLGAFLFSGESIEKTVRVLSGGERVRLALAKLSLMGANLFLLDEPTTHLDLRSQEALEDSLAAFSGTILLVSHDRYLIDALATQVWYISPQRRQLTVFKGGYSEFAEERAREGARQRERQRQTNPGAQPPIKSSRKLRQEIEKIEARVSALESRLQSLATALDQAGGDLDQVRSLGEQFAETEAELERQLLAWEHVQRQA